jgi:hypothetical protein
VRTAVRLRTAGFPGPSSLSLSCSRASALALALPRALALARSLSLSPTHTLSDARTLFLAHSLGLASRSLSLALSLSLARALSPSPSDDSFPFRSEQSSLSFLIFFTPPVFHKPGLRADLNNLNINPNYLDIHLPRHKPLDINPNLQLSFLNPSIVLYGLTVYVS